jgi:hypothetical protein
MGVGDLFHHWGLIDLAVLLCFHLYAAWKSGSWRTIRIYSRLSQNSTNCLWVCCGALHIVCINVSPHELWHVLQMYVVGNFLNRRGRTNFWRRFFNPRRGSRTASEGTLGRKIQETHEDNVLTFGTHGFILCQ